MAFWLTLAFVSSLADCLFTYRRIEKYGLEIELNPAIRWLSKYTQSLLATMVGIMLPSWLLMGGLVFLNWEAGLAAYAGARVTLNWFQIASIRYEESYDEYLRTVKERNGQANNSDGV